jgi:NAD(P)-dependent dehydrogenase (short-subunit alcohol dehydrogenase family)
MIATIDLGGKTAVITGIAGGQGREAAIAFAEAGAHIGVATSRFLAWKKP